ncbi:hypothetical protein EE612_012880, partial [Oryza sativa]
FFFSGHAIPSHLGPSSNRVILSFSSSFFEDNHQGAVYNPWGLIKYPIYWQSYVINNQWPA